MSIGRGSTVGITKRKKCKKNGSSIVSGGGIDVIDGCEFPPTTVFTNPPRYIYSTYSFGCRTFDGGCDCEMMDSDRDLVSVVWVVANSVGILRMSLG